MFILFPMNFSISYLIQIYSTLFTFSSRHDPYIQAGRLNHKFPFPTLEEASESVSRKAVMPSGLESSGRWHHLTYNKTMLAFLVSLCLLVEAPVCSHLRKMYSAHRAHL